MAEYTTHHFQSASRYTVSVHYDRRLYAHDIAGSVAHARMLARQARVLILDEPTAGLDPISASAFDDLIISLKENLGLTIVIITHDIDTLVKVCDRVAVLVDKKITVDTLGGIMEHENEWIQSYFHGERMRALKEPGQQNRGSNG